MARNFLVGVAVALTLAALVQTAPNKHAPAIEMTLTMDDSEIQTHLDRPVRVWAHPNAFYTPGEDGSRGTGFFIDMLDQLTKITRIQFTVEPHPELAFARKNNDGTWEGTLVGALMQDQCDLIGPNIIVNSDAEKVIDYTTPFAPYKLMVVYNKAFGLPFVQPIPQYVIQDTHDLVYLMTSGNKTLEEIYRNVEAGRPDSIVTSDDEGIQLVAKGNFAYIMESTFINGAIEHAGVDTDMVVVSPFELGKYFFNAWAVQLGTKSDLGHSLRQDLDVALEMMNEAGVIQQLLLKHGVGLEL